MSDEDIKVKYGSFTIQIVTPGACRAAHGYDKTG